MIIVIFETRNYVFIVNLNITKKNVKNCTILEDEKIHERSFVSLAKTSVFSVTFSGSYTPEMLVDRKKKKKSVARRRKKGKTLIVFFSRFSPLRTRQIDLR